MNAVLRFWIAVFSLVVSVAAVSYLFLSFLFPETILVLQARAVRLGVTFVALVATGLLLWSTVLADSAKQAQPPKK
jgi:hypothetical protein